MPRAQRGFNPVEVLRVRRQELIRDEQGHPERLDVVGAHVLQHGGDGVARERPRLNRHRGIHDVLHSDDVFGFFHSGWLEINQAGAKAAHDAADGREGAADLFLPELRTVRPAGERVE